jgi:phosphate transport system protein
MPEKFKHEMEGLIDEVGSMGALVQGMLADAVNALETQDVELARSVLGRKEELYGFDNDIEEHALKVLTLHQPMAKDMRRLACILKIITYMTRIGRYGYDIAKVTIDTAETPHITRLIEIPFMADTANAMLGDALATFRDEDISRFDDFTDRDDKLDKLRYSIFREALSYVMEKPVNITMCMHYVMVARYLERCGDHACKMAEKIIYMVNGDRVEIS